MKSLQLVCVFLLPLQTLALPLRNRSSFPSKPGKLSETQGGIAMETITIPSIASSAGARERRAVWRALLHKGPPLKQTNTPANQNREHFREYRHVLRGSRSYPQGQLKRVRCVLGTCQVQNLSHRLYQLNKQNGRQDAPINPRSPHSYG
ncbi:ADM2-like [Sinocyclocheilus anshuiensis]|uniref:ADM2-like n=1 Tax=Sinocyclocheilus anshuiensis TaxID=1608454 RepID=UPI0007BAD80B|nr:PREDICTED: ADM2-like [Sinocyclocheilus anshuiensis]